MKIVNIKSAPYFGVPLSPLNLQAGAACLIREVKRSGSSPQLWVFPIQED